MQRLPMNLLEPGMVVAKPVTNDKGIVLVSEGTELSDRLITRLENMSVGKVMVRGYPVRLAGFTPKSLQDKLADMEKGFSPVAESETMKRFKVLVKAHFIRKEELMHADAEGPAQTETAPETPAEE
jgi:hypothetical protein